MRINRNNYEAFFLDFVEGRLDNSSTLEMLAFLRKNPELKEELEAFSDIRLPDKAEVFEDKSLLKKLNFSDSEVNFKNFEDFCIAYHEKILTPAESEKLLYYLAKYPDKLIDFQQYGRLYLKADKNLFFEAKPFLQRKHQPFLNRKVILRWTAVAAGIVLAVAVFYRSPVKEIKVTNGNKQLVVTKDNNIEEAINQHSNSEKDSGKDNLPFSNVSKKYDKKPEKIDVVETSKEDLEYIAPIEVAEIEKAPVSDRIEIKLSRDTALLAVMAEEEFKLEQETKFSEDGNTIKNIFKKKTTKKGNRKISLWDVAEVTLKGYNQLSEKDILLHRETDENGKLTAIAVETENRKYGFNTRN